MLDARTISSFGQDKGGDGYKGVHWALLALERHGEEPSD